MEGSAAVEVSAQLADNGEILSEKIFDENYDISKKLGSGCYADVYLCKLKKTQKTFAVKKIHISKNKYTSQFNVYKEIDILKKLNHPNVIKFEAVFESPIDLLVVVEYVRGCNLLEYLVRCDGLNEIDAKIVMKGLLSAVDYIHDKSIIHRDICPGNILLKLNNQKKIVNAKLGDFGFADEGEVFTTEVVGTYIFMAPEMKTLYDDKVDIYSAGIVMFAVLTKKISLVFSMFCFEGKSPKLNGASSDATKLYDNLVCHCSEDRFTAKQALQHKWLR